MNSRLFLTTLAISAAAAAPAAAKPADVNVVNTVSVAGTVGLDPAANGVQVTNTAPIPVAPVPAPAPAAAVYDVRIILADGRASDATTLIPGEELEGRRFEGTSIVASSVLPDGDRPILVLNTQVGGNPVPMILPMQPLDQAGPNTSWNAVLPMGLIADDTTSVSFTRVGGSEGEAGVLLAAFGHLIDEPEGA